MDWGATAAEFRSRGSQGLLLHRRIQYAYELGCAHLFTATGEAVAGDPQHSYHNMTRFGFLPMAVRANLELSN